MPDDTDYGENVAVEQKKRRRRSRFEQYLDDEARNIADEIPECLSPVNGKSVMVPGTQSDQKSKVKAGVINDGRPVKKNNKRAVSFIEDSQFEFN